MAVPFSSCSCPYSSQPDRVCIYPFSLPWEFVQPSISNSTADLILPGLGTGPQSRHFFPILLQLTACPFFRFFFVLLHESLDKLGSWLKRGQLRWAVSHIPDLAPTFVCMSCVLLRWRARSFLTNSCISCYRCTLPLQTLGGVADLLDQNTPLFTSNIVMQLH